MRSGTRPLASERLLRLQGWLDQEGEELNVRIAEPVQEGVWCDGVIEESTLKHHFKIGDKVRLLPDISTFLLEHE